MQPTRIGHFEIARIADYEGPFFAPGEFFPDFDAAVVEEHAALLGPRLIEPGTGKLIFSFHSFIVKTGHHTILIDSCIGNDKERPTRPQFHRMKSSFIDDLARLGVKPEDIDFVMCTHLHWDHVGWNTRLADGQWVPTFPNARYVMAQREYDHWLGVHDSGVDTPHARAFGDSILPVVKTGQALLVGDNYALDDALVRSLSRPYPGQCRDPRQIGRRAWRVHRGRSAPPAAMPEAGMVDDRLHRSRRVPRQPYATGRGTRRAGHPDPAGAFPGADPR